MDALNTKIKNIKTEKALKVRPENIKSGVSIFGINGTYTGLVPTGTLSITENGTVDVTNYASADVNVSASSGGKNVQYLRGAYATIYTAYTSSGLSLTVNKTGIYKISWLAQRMNTSGTHGTALYINNSLYGNTYETWGMSYYRNRSQAVVDLENWQKIEIDNVSLTENDVVTIYSRSNSNNTALYNYDLIIEEN